MDSQETVAQSQSLETTGSTLYSVWPRNARLITVGGEISASIASARALIHNNRSKSTRDKYARDFALFARWLIGIRPDETIIPTHRAILGLYIGALHNQNLTKARILSRIAALQYANDVLGFRIRVDEGQIQRQIRGLRRTRDAERQPRTAMLREEATDILLHLGQPKTLFECRDRAILALGWTSALRRSNLAALRLGDLRIDYDPAYKNRYLEIFVRESKTDQEAQGRFIIITEMPGDQPLCAVRAIEAWIERAGIAEEKHLPLFRSFTQARDPRQRRITLNGLDGRDIAKTIKRLASATGRNADAYSAHALRRGFATSAELAGVRRSLVREHGGWKSDAMLDRYTRVDRARDNAIAEIFGKKKT